MKYVHGKKKPCSNSEFLLFTNQASTYIILHHYKWTREPLPPYCTSIEFFRYLRLLVLFFFCTVLTFFSESFYVAFHLSTTSEKPNKRNTVHGGKKKRKKIKNIHRNFTVPGRAGFCLLLLLFFNQTGTSGRILHVHTYHVEHRTSRRRQYYFHLIEGRR